ncbi:MAG: hypothetical protein ACRC0R_05095 [Cetobacterium sp.]
MSKTANFMTGNANFEVQFKHNFRIYIEGLPDFISLSTVNFPIPNWTIAEEEIAFGNQSVYVAGKATVDGGDFVCNDYVPLDVERTLYEWFRIVYDPATGIRGRAHEYKKSATIVLLESDMTSTPRKWKCEGLWPTGFNAGSELSYEDATKKQITLTLKFDNAYPIR